MQHKGFPMADPIVEGAHLLHGVVKNACAAIAGLATSCRKSPGRRCGRAFEHGGTGLAPSFVTRNVADGASAIRQRRRHTIGWAATFLIIAIIAGLLGFTGIAGASANIAWILFVVGLVLAVLMFLTGRRPPI
jgi:uncharacterized membrane protein YtjA (UPF0391 family)